MNVEFWKGKRILITGHTGFKGSWLSMWLESAGAAVIGYSLPPPTSPNLFELANVGSNIVSQIGDIKNLSLLKETILFHRPEIIIHLAAQSLVRKSYLNPIETYSTNVMGTLNLFEAVRQIGGVKVILNITSDKCYENREWVWGYREIDPMGGADIYSSSKGCAELLTSSYRTSFFNPAQHSEHEIALASARAGNVIGGGDWAEDRLIPDLIKSFLANEPAFLRNPSAIRPWQHVLDALNGYLILAEKLYEFGPDFSEAWNFGPHESNSKPVSWIADYFTKLWGEGTRWNQDQSKHPSESNFLRLDSSKAREKLKWNPKLNIETTLEWIVEWTKAFQERKNLKDFTHKQIKNFQQLKDCK